MGARALRKVTDGAPGRDASLRLGRGRPDPVDERVVRAIAGTMLAWPWFDRAALFMLRRWFFPVSRLWAAARQADGDAGRFFEAVPVSPRPNMHDRVARVLSVFEQARAAAFAIEKDWDLMFFGAEDANLAKREAIEAARLSHRHAYNATRRHFRFLVDDNTPRVSTAIATPDDVANVYGGALKGGIAKLTTVLCPTPSIEVSQRISGPAGEDYWLRFTSPSQRLNDKVYARVHEPVGVKDPPTVIFGHGICVEFDHWHGLVDECHALARMGFRVIRPEAPWHGRRNQPGRFGGETIIASFPMGLLDAVFGAVLEWAALAAWARETSRGPLAFAGSSLGALTAQFAADRARDWTESLRPDALLLLTHTRDLSDVVMNGALANLWMSPAEVEARGWTEELARTYLQLLEPAERLPLAAERIVSVLGRRDLVLPFKSGRELTEAWCVPERNLFVWDRGHFSVPMTLIRNQAPLHRFAEVMSAVERS